METLRIGLSFQAAHKKASLWASQVDIPGALHNLCLVASRLPG